MGSAWMVSGVKRGRRDGTHGKGGTRSACAPCLTGVRCVNKIITDMAVMEDALTDLLQNGPGVTVGKIRAATALRSRSPGSEGNGLMRVMAVDPERSLRHNRVTGRMLVARRNHPREGRPGTGRSHRREGSRTRSRPDNRRVPDTDDGTTVTAHWPRNGLLNRFAGTPTLKYGFRRTSGC